MLSKIISFLTIDPPPKQKDLELRFIESKSLLDAAAQSTIQTAIDVTHELKNRVKDYTDQIQFTSNLLSNAMITINYDGTIKTFNHAAHDMFKTLNNDMIGFNICMLFRNNDESILDFTDFHKNLQCGKPNGCFQKSNIKGRRLDGELFWCEVKCNNYLDSAGSQHFVIMLYDIDEKVKIEKKLFNKDLFEKTYTNLSFDVVFIHNFVSILDVSLNFFEIFGYDISDLPKLDPYTLMRKQHWIEKENTSYNEYYTEIVHKNGTLVPVNIRTTPVLWCDNIANMVTISLIRY